MNSKPFAPGTDPGRKRLPALAPMYLLFLLIPLGWFLPSAPLLCAVALLVSGGFAILCLYESRPARVLLPLILFPILAGILSRSVSGAILTLCMFFPALPEILIRKQRMRFKDSLIVGGTILFLLLLGACLAAIPEHGYEFSSEGLQLLLAPMLSDVRSLLSSMKGELFGEQVPLFSKDAIEGILNLLLGTLPGILGAVSGSIVWIGSHVCRSMEKTFGFSERKTRRAFRMSLLSSVLFLTAAILFFAIDGLSSALTELVSGNLLLLLFPGFLCYGTGSFFRRLFRTPSLLSLLLLILIPLFFLQSPFTALMAAAVYGACATIFRCIRLSLRVLMNRADGSDE